MRVVLACDGFLRYSAGLAAGLQVSGADVVLLTRDHDLEFGGQPGAARQFVRDAVGDRVDHLELPGRVRSPHGQKQAARLRSELRRFAPDIVHLQNSITNDPRLMVAAGARRGRFALTLHDPTPHLGDSVSRIQVLATRLLARRAGLIFVHGEALQTELSTKVTTRAPVVVVPHGVDPGTTSPLPDRPSVLFFGRLSHYKGLDVLLDAMAEVWRQLPATTLTVAGDGSIAAHPALRDPRVRVQIGHVPDNQVPGLFSAAGCVALPYREASQSGVGSLAKGYARPMVVTSVGGLPELVADGSGLIVPPENPRRLAAALTSLLSDRRLAERLGAAGARTATRQASWDGVAELTLQAYREHLLPSSSPSG